MDELIALWAGMGTGLVFKWSELKRALNKRRGREEISQEMGWDSGNQKEGVVVWWTSG